jgi:hypothetical protein
VSYIFSHRSKVVWSPSLTTGEVYVGQAASLSSICGRSSGLSPMAADYYYIDSQMFASFIQALTHTQGLADVVAVNICRGFIVVSLVMLERCGLQLDVSDSYYDQDLIAAVEIMKPHMAF